MVAFGRRGERIHVYAPRPGDVESHPLAAGEIDAALDWSTRLGVAHEPGEHEVIVRFFRGAVGTDAAIAGDVAPALELRGRLVVTEEGGP